MGAVLGELDFPLPEQRSRVTAIAMRVSTSLAFAVLTAASASVRGDKVYSATITIRNHRFEPSEIHVPAGKRIVFIILMASYHTARLDRCRKNSDV